MYLPAEKRKLEKAVQQQKIERKYYEKEGWNKDEANPKKCSRYKNNSFILFLGSKMRHTRVSFIKQGMMISVSTKHEKFDRGYLMPATLEFWKQNQLTKLFISIK